MLENEKISVHQFRVLVTFFTIGTSILVYPAILAKYAKQDAWLVVIISMSLGLAVLWMFSRIAQLFPNMNIAQMNEKVFGKWLGKLFTVFMVWNAFLASGELLHYSGVFFRINLMPEIPIEVLHIMTALLLVMAVRIGLETFSRAAEIFWVLFIFLFLVMFFVIPEIKFEHIQPVLENGLKPLLYPTLILLSFSTFNAIYLLMIFPAHVSNPQKAQKAFYIGLIIGGIITFITTILAILVLGAELTARLRFPVYLLAQKINVGEFVKRIEVIVATMWFIAVYFKMILYFYACCLGIGQILNLKSYRPIVLPMGMILTAFASMMFPNVVEQQQWDVRGTLILSNIAGGFLPLLVLIVGYIRSKT
ncbi:GerAB/ArcD/ProY family transporter [Niallia endozanthoxylica]|uniref:GerAB/ArcD/ProY family transporter n=1 Tax=Niallia endozanthoxylica TaxID=2036016 RepID=A0A5J5I364_9BACI|nr:endospore germination permease [Niallia endozanthoxylica]KAA9030667.1 GerAB/ArcD/ProY family transporter [Niallia endozanthoxylica]